MYLFNQGAALPRGAAGRRATLVATRKGLHQLVRQLTVNYDAVAGIPLQRQSSRLICGLSPREEASEPAEVVEVARDSVTQTLPQDVPLPAWPLTRSDSKELFLEALEVSNHNVGFSKRYDLRERIGQGYFAKVNLCSNKVTGVVYAVKKLTTDKRINVESIRDEIRFLMEARHPNILRAIDTYAEHEDRCVYIVLELAQEGELFNYIVMKRKLTEEESRRLFSQVFAAVEYMVSMLKA